MKRLIVDAMTVEQLVDQFSATALEQDVALLQERITQVNRLYDRLKVLEGELQPRDGDQRRALVRLYAHPNPQVRVKAMTATLAVAPEKSRRALQELAASREYPQSGEAGMTIRALDRGIFKPT